MYKKLPFDPLTDLVPVVLLASAPNVILVEQNSPFKTLQEVVKAARSNPKELNLATPGNGTPSHLISELFQKTADIQLTHVPYKGAAGALTDLIGGRVSLMMSSVPTALGQIKMAKFEQLQSLLAKEFMFYRMSQPLVSRVIRVFRLVLGMVYLFLKIPQLVLSKRLILPRMNH